jgi:AcrR family transcriptional regulator
METDVARHHSAETHDKGASFDLLWKAPTPPRRGPKPSFTLDDTIQAGIAIADAEGLGAVTMNRVALKTGVTTMALYRYVPSKSALVDLMADDIMKSPPELCGQHWRADISQWAHANLFLIRRHPWLFDVISTRAAVGPNWARWLDAGLQALTKLPLSASEMLAVLLLVDGHFRASAQVMVGAKATAEWAGNFGKMLHRVTGDERYPTLTDMVITGRFEEPGLDLDGMFQFGLDRILDGVDDFVASRRP